VPEAPTGEGVPTPVPGTPLDRSGLVPTSEDNLGKLARLVAHAREPRIEIAAIIRQPNSDMDWRKPISEYLWLGTILDDGTKTWRLARLAKGYLIHFNKLYHHIISSILQWFIPIEEGEALLFDIQEGVCGHHASSRSMVGKAFQ
jgi:hypothetical protein